ncbi:2953_t:CDS:2, partial [Racocetra persica]
DQNSNNTDSEEESCQENNIINDEMFTITNSGNRITAVNLRIDYMYRGKQLENIENDLNINNLTLDPYMIMRSGLNNTKFVDDTMFHLYLNKKFNTENKTVFQNETSNSYNNDQIRPSNENDDYLIRQ